MADLGSIVVPLFGLILLGGLAAQSTVLAKNGRRVVDWLLFRLALPALVFDVLANAAPADLGNWSYFLTLTFGTYCAFAVSFTIAALRQNGDIRAASIEGAVGSHGSLGYFAPALILFALGPTAAVPLAVILVLDGLLMRVLLPMLWAFDGRDRQPWSEVLRRIGRLVVDQPMFPAAIAGAGFALAGIGAPAGIGEAVAALGSASVPLGLVGVGLALATFRSETGGEARLKWTPALLTKLLIHPLIVYLLLGWAGNFDPDWMYAAVLMAALPPATGLHAMARGSARAEPMDSVAATGVLASIITISVLVLAMSEGLIAPDPFF